MFDRIIEIIKEVIGAYIINIGMTNEYFKFNSSNIFLAVECAS